MIIVRLLSPGPWLVGTTKAYSGIGADIVMESITLTDPVPLLPLGGKNAHFQKRWSGHSYEVETVLYFFDALTFFHRAFCAAAILFLPAADILRRALCVQTCPR